MIPYDSLPNDDLDLIDSCTERALPFMPLVAGCDIELSLVKAHSYQPLELAVLLKFGDMDFIHDVAGIVRHVDRFSGCLGDFTPRCGFR